MDASSQAWTSMQEGFIQNTHRYVLFCGHRACGKTYAACAKSLAYARAWPGARLLICCPTDIVARAIVFPYLHALCVTEGGGERTQFNLLERTCTLVGDAVIFVRTQDDIRAESAGVAVSMVGVDEIGLVGQDVWNMLKARLRQAPKGYPPQAWATTSFPRPEWAHDEWEEAPTPDHTMFVAPKSDSPVHVQEALAAMVGSVGQQKL